MPSSTSSSERSAGFPTACCLALLAYLAADQLLWRFEPWLRFCQRYAPLYSALDYPIRAEMRVRLLPAEAPAPPILLLGSSQVYEGLDCWAFERRFPGRTCENLGIAAGTPLDMLYLLNRASAHSRRHVAVVAFFPSTLHKGPKPAYTDVTTLRILMRSGAWAHLAPSEWLDVARGEVENLSETLRMNASLQKVWGFVHGNLAAALRHELPAPRPREFQPRPLAELQAKMGKILDPEATPGRFTVANELAIDEIVSDEVRRGNRLIVVDCPTREGYETIVTREAVAHYHGLLDRLAGRPGVVLVRRADLPSLENADFRDLVHPLPGGRLKTSTGLAETLARIEGSP